MIHLFDQALEAFLRATVPLPTNGVDVSFAAPDRTWGASIVRPTVNLFLWDVQRNLSRTASGYAGVEGDGRLHRQRPRPVVDLRYLVTAWAGDQRDEHQLLGAVLRAVLLHPVLGGEYLPASLNLPSSVLLELAASDDRRPGDFWSAIDGQLKPGLHLTVTSELDAARVVEAGPPVTGIDVRTTDRSSGARSGQRAVASRAEDGAVRTRRSAVVEPGRPADTTVAPGHGER